MRGWPLSRQLSTVASSNRPAARVWAALDHSDRIFSLLVTEDVEDGIARDRANRWFTALQRGATVVELVLLPGQDPRCGDAVHIDEEWVGRLLDGALVTGRGTPLAPVEGGIHRQRIEAQERADILGQPVVLVATGDVFTPGERTETEDEWTDEVDPSRAPAVPLALGLLIIVGSLVLAGWML